MMKAIKTYNLVVRFLFLLLICAGCSSTKVTVLPSNASIDLTDYGTFDFFKLEASGDTTSEFHQRITLIKSIIVEEMNERGLKIDPTHPELKINLGIILEDKTQTRQTSLADPGEWNYVGQRNYKWESQTVEVGSYKEGSLTLHLVDANNDEALWIGLIEGVLPKNKQKRQRKINKAVTALFAKIDPV